MGIAPSAASASKRNAAASAGTSNLTTERASRRALVVLPVARGPTISSAGNWANRSASGLSTRRGV